MGKFFISCDEASTICDKNQYGEAAFSDKIKMVVHVLRCKVCQCYSKQNTVMTKVYDEYAVKNCKKPKCMPAKDKERLEKALKEKMK